MKKQTILLSILSAGAVFAASPDYNTFIAHRGESHDAPENTLPAYKMAVERGFGFECDVYLSKDGRVFTFHDNNLKRTTGGANTKACCDVTWAELEKVDVGNWGKWKDSRFKGTRPALLEEVLALARDGRKIYVEVKPGPEIVPAIKRVFAAQSKATPENTLFISFNEESCKALKREMPDYKVYWLVSSQGCRRQASSDYGGWHHRQMPQVGRGWRRCAVRPGNRDGRFCKGCARCGFRVPRLDGRQAGGYRHCVLARRRDCDHQLCQEAA